MYDAFNNKTLTQCQVIKLEERKIKSPWAIDTVFSVVGMLDNNLAGFRHPTPPPAQPRFDAAILPIN